MDLRTRHAGIPACVLVLNRAKRDERKGRVLMIDTSAGFARRDTKNVLTEDAIDRVTVTYKSGDEVDGFAKWVSEDEIAAHHYNLVVRRFVGGGETNGEVLDLDDAIAAYREARAAREEAEARLDEMLANLEET